MLTIAIICKNAENSLAATLESIKWADKIVMLDDGSKDNSVEIAKKYGATVLNAHRTSFAEKRNELLKKIDTDWILYLDTDEVVPTPLKDEIQAIVQNNRPASFTIRRENFFLGTKMYPDQVERLFHKAVLKKWTGAVHESPETTMKSRKLANPMIHHTHTTITSMLEKTNYWSEIEADLRIQANHPPMAWWRLVRIAITEWWHQFGKLRVGQFGRPGIFEGYFQMVDKIIVYVKLWERQQQS